ncbi:MAG: MBL fold metallo-hydrolase [Rhodospirillaceae bacterium]
MQRRFIFPFCLLVLAILPLPLLATCLLGISQNNLGPRFVSERPSAGSSSLLVRYLGHSSFLLVSPKGVTAVTDFNGLHSPAFPPNIVTMNNSHGTHYTDSPDPRIRHVLRGWSGIKEQGFVRYNLKLRDMRVWNIPTNIGEYGDPRRNGNSIFIFQVSNLCVAHLGHLHHMLDRQQLLELGRIDVLFVPADGSSTLSHPEAMSVIKQIEPRLVLPMHFGFYGAVESFSKAAGALWPVRFSDKSDYLVNQINLPRRTEILFLTPYKTSLN